MSRGCKFVRQSGRLRFPCDLCMIVRTETRALDGSELSVQLAQPRWLTDVAVAALAGGCAAAGGGRPRQNGIGQVGTAVDFCVAHDHDDGSQWADAGLSS